MGVEDTAKFFRADTRKGLKVAEPKGLYEDGGGRPDGCKSEVAFADSVGGAVYGAATGLLFSGGNFNHIKDAPNDVRQQLWFSDEVAFTLHVYEAKEQPEEQYDPYPKGIDSVLNRQTDFLETGERRFCKPVKVKPKCSCDITWHDITVLSRLLPIANEYDLDYDRMKKDFEECQKDPNSKKCIDKIAEVQTKVINGDKAMRKYLLQEPKVNVDYDYYYVEGVNTEVVSELIKKFNKECE